MSRRSPRVTMKNRLKRGVASAAVSCSFSPLCRRPAWLLILVFFSLSHVGNVQAKHFPDQGQAYAECQLVGQLFLQQFSFYSNQRCIAYPANQCGGNPCYLCVADNVKGQNYNAQCNSVPNRSAVNTYDAAGTCAARPSEQNNGSMLAGTLRCSTGCEIAVANDGLIKPTGGVCTVPSLKIEPAKNNCCDVGDPVTAG
jgi:hypothetical protein